MYEANRSRRLGDVNANDPSNWDWGGPGKLPHLLTMIYAKHGRINATLPETLTVEDITLEQAVTLLAAQAEKKGKKPAAKKTAAKKTAAKKTGTKKAAAKKTSAKKKPAAKKTAAKKTPKSGTKKQPAAEDTGQAAKAKSESAAAEAAE